MRFWRGTRRLYDLDNVGERQFRMRTDGMSGPFMKRLTVKP